MMRKFALILATLPVMAGFAVPAYSQNMPAHQGAADAMLLRMSQLEGQIRELTGQVEQREYQIRRLQESYDAFVESTNARLRTLEGGSTASSSAPASAPAATPPQPTATAPTPPASSDYDAPYNPGGTAGNLGQIDTPAQQPDGTITSGRAQPSTMNPAQAYDFAFGYLQEKNYAAAEAAFVNFLKEHPSHSLAGNAQYWLGETYYVQSQYPNAARTFAKAFQDYPQGQKAPDALFKLALTLEQMHKKEDACLTISELKKRFPTGPASVLRRADEEALRMQCQS